MYRCRPRLILPVLLCLALAVGCKGNKKDPNAPDQSAGKSARGNKGKSDAKLEQAQRDARQKPDKFETSDDPPLSADTHFAAGQLSEYQGNFPAAIAQFQEALKLNPNHRNALYHLGQVYTATRQYGEAFAVWQRYLKVTNYSPAAYNNLALCYEQAGRLEDAEKAYKAGIEKDPSDPSCRVNYGLMLARHGRIDDATAQLQTVLSPAETQYNLGSVYEQLGNRDEAKRRYRKALELDPKLADARRRLADLKE
jgi:tetratricopeptide (TPR) repeat protein